MKSVIKWAGGKTQLLPEIESRFPYGKRDIFIYVEPFVGGGAVLFWVLNNYPKIRKAVINDVNSDLMNMYSQIKTNIEGVISILAEWEQKYLALDYNSGERKGYYYSKRNFFNRRTSHPETQAALFLFLNKTCFNGLYRVNRNNEFNVPIGSYKNPRICDVCNLRKASIALQKVEIINGDFEETIKYVRGDSFFYLDPPYKSLSKTSSFSSYTKEGFNDTEQVRLRKFCAKLESTMCKWMVSNSSNSFFDILYTDCRIDRVFARRNINSNGAKRGQIPELLITNKEQTNALL